MNTIPSILHFIWLGSPVPEWGLSLIEEFRTLHPHWDLRLHTEYPESFYKEFGSLIETLPFWCQRADLLRYWLLWEYGGIYIDIDTVPVKPFDAWCRYEFCMAGDCNRDKINNGVMAAAKGLQDLQIILESCKQKYQKLLEIGKSPERAEYGPLLLARLLREKRISFNLFPTSSCYPLSRDKAHEFWHASQEKRRYLLEEQKYDEEHFPYVVSLFGVENSSLNSPTLIREVNLQEYLLNLPEPIALVGNGQILKTYGEQINKYPTVIRFNYFKLEGYEERVGDKTTHWCVNKNRIAQDKGLRILKKQKFKGAILHPWILKNGIESWKSSKLKKLSRSSFDIHVFTEQPPYSEVLGKQRPTTGFRIAHPLAKMGKVLHFYGFDGLQSAHYFNEDHHHKLRHHKQGEKEPEILSSFPNCTFF